MLLPAQGDESGGVGVECFSGLPAAVQAVQQADRSPRYSHWQQLVVQVVVQQMSEATAAGVEQQGGGTVRVHRVQLKKSLLDF